MIYAYYVVLQRANPGYACMDVGMLRCVDWRCFLGPQSVAVIFYGRASRGTLRMYGVSKISRFEVIPGTLVVLQKKWYELLRVFPIPECVVLHCANPNSQGLS